ncbi:MAG: translation initiation factor IF-2 [Pirellulales bacterium]
MPIRIYALAKDLKIDSKELVDLCVKAGIPGKGSALASLDDDEVVKLKAYLSGSTKRAAPRPSAPDLTPIPPSVSPPVMPRQIPIMPARSSASSSQPQESAATATSSLSTSEAAAGGLAESAAPAGTVASGAAPDMAASAAAADETALAAAAEPSIAAPTDEARGVSDTAAGSTAAIAAAGSTADLTEVAAGSVAPTAGLDVAGLAGDAAAASVAGSAGTGPAAKGAGSTSARAPGAGSTGAGSTSASSAGAGSAGLKGPASRTPSSDAPGAPTRPGADAPGFSRQDYISPGGSTGRIRILDNRGAKKPTGGDGDAAKPPPLKRREPVINLAKLPEVKQPTPTAKSTEPPAQKPDIRLPKDAIRGAKAGARPPLEHLTSKAEQRKARPGGDKPAAAGPRGPQPPAAPAGADAAGKAAGGRTRRHRDGAPAEGADTERDLAGMASARADRKKGAKLKAPDKLTTRPEDDDDSLSHRRARRLTRRSVGVSTAAPRKGKVAVETPCTVREFSEATGVGSGQILKVMMTMGIPVNINASLNQDQVELLAAELGLDIELKAQQSLEDTLINQIDDVEDDPAMLEPRPPVVTFLGHVDHGKTSLLDRLIGIDVASREAGGITQHIRAYEISKNGRKIAFVDTPGHEAFTEMRARGANVTDIAVLVVAADDGVMPQTEEAISHAKAAGVPIVVALNKMDLPGAKADRVLQQLAAQGLMPSEWSGDVEVVRCSAMTGAGLDELLDTLLVTADLHEYKANPKRAARGVCLEAEQEAGRGVIAKVMVKNGTLNVGDIVVCGAAHGRVKAMYDTLKPNVRLKKAGPSTPVNLTGLDIAPQAGDSFHVLEDISQAREIAASRAVQQRQSNLAGSSRVSFDQFQQLLTEGRLGEKQQAVTLNLILRADVRGSIEAILKELSKFSHPEVQLKVLQAAVGGVTVADVTLAHASNAVILGFNVIPDDAARTLADERQVEIRRYDIIYKVSDDIKAMLEGKLKPEERVVELGQAIVKQTFVISRVGTVAGCYVARGTIERNCRVRVFRDGRTIGEYAIDSLKREKDDAKEVSRGMECGIRLVGFNDVKKDDVFEAYKVEEVARTL